ncbi:MAG TPA: M20/M25/M40 family metallo-hydrolase, partial [Chthoniobacterales bacterium]
MHPSAWIESQQEELVRTVVRWSNRNTGSANVAGLQSFSDELIAEFAELRPDRVEKREVTSPAGPSIPLLVFQKRTEASRRVFLFGHLDTVFGPDHPFQRATVPGDGRILGPGVCDMKGGLAVLLCGLRAFEGFIEEKRLGWTVVINSDEEVGSPASSASLVEEARG